MKVMIRRMVVVVCSRTAMQVGGKLLAAAVQGTPAFRQRNNLARPVESLPLPSMWIGRACESRLILRLEAGKMVERRVLWILPIRSAVQRSGSQCFGYHDYSVNSPACQEPISA